MNINITPSAVAVDTAANLLAFLEMAKNPNKLKAVLDQIKTAQDEAAGEAAAARAAKDDAASTLAAVQAQAESAQVAMAKAREEFVRATQASADADAVRAAVKVEREKFDGWMAGEREALAAAKAKVDSDAAANLQRTGDLDVREAEVEGEMTSARRLQSAAEKLRVEYEQKIAALKSMI